MNWSTRFIQGRPVDYFIDEFEHFATEMDRIRHVCLEDRRRRLGIKSQHHDSRIRNPHSSNHPNNILHGKR